MPAPSQQSETDPSTRNFALLALYQVFMRIGWIFKTESIIMPAVLDTLSNATGWMRGALPLLNRFGQSIAPLLAVAIIRRAPRKKWCCVVVIIIMSLTFVGMAAIWYVPAWTKSAAAPVLFLSLYGLFFICLGINQVSQFTLQGKIIPVTRRGRLLSVANGFGSAGAVLCALLFLPMWLRETEGDFDYLFSFTALLFACAAFVMAMIQEPADVPSQQHEHKTSALGLAWRALQKNKAFRRLALVALLFGTSAIIFPHYQALAGQNFGTDMRRLIGWVIIQNIGTGIFSIPLGMLADRFGTRLVLRITLFGVCLIPPTALWISTWTAGGETAYSLVFMLIGLSPVALRTFNDYTLEVSPQAEHPQYLSTINLCISAPILVALPAGWLIDRIGFQPVFVAITILLCIGWLLTFGLSEPRNRKAHIEMLNPKLLDSVND
jgi:MFS family permease